MNKEYPHSMMYIESVGINLLYTYMVDLQNQTGKLAEYYSGYAACSVTFRDIRVHITAVYHIISWSQ